MEPKTNTKRVALSEEETKTDSNLDFEKTNDRKDSRIQISLNDRKMCFDKTQTEILKEWIKSHEEFTYPKYDDLAELIEMTGLTDKQIRVWFTNHRNRKQSRAETCMSRIKYSIQSKNFQRRSKKLKDKLVRETSKYYLSKYFCVCDVNMGAFSDDENEKISNRVKKYLKACNYCSCCLPS